MSNKFIAVDGGKGGVGKSTLSILISDYLMRNGEDLAVVDADKTNPDVARLFNNAEAENVTAILAGLQSAQGFVELYDVMEKEIDGHDIVLSLPATLDMRPYVADIAEVCKEMDLEIVHVFVINRQWDSINLLKESMENGLASIADRKVVVRNGFFGDHDDFSRWDSSKTRSAFLESGGEEIHIPGILDITMDAVLELNKPFSEAAVRGAGLSIGIGVQTKNWLKGVDERLASLEL